MLVDDQDKKILFYASTLQKFIREDPYYTVMVSLPLSFFLSHTHTLKSADVYFDLLLRFKKWNQIDIGKRKNQ
jgi:hypothetical protein